MMRKCQIENSLALVERIISVINFYTNSININKCDSITLFLHKCDSI